MNNIEIIQGIISEGGKIIYNEIPCPKVDAEREFVSNAPIPEVYMPGNGWVSKPTFIPGEEIK